MPGEVYGQNFSVRVLEAEAARFDAIAAAAGLRRSELLRLVILDAIRRGAITVNGADLRRARTVGAP